jgi:hypothetical protein
MGMASVHTHDRKADALQLMPQPTGHRARLEADPFGCFAEAIGPRVLRRAATRDYATC